MPPKEKPLKISLDQLEAQHAENQHSLVGRKFEIKGDQGKYIAEIVGDNEYQQIWALQGAGLSTVFMSDVAKFASMLMKYGIISVTASGKSGYIDSEFIVFVNKHQQKDQVTPAG